MNYYWGKAIFSLFLASLAFSNAVEPLLQYLVTIYFVLCATAFIVLMCIDRAHDRDQAKKDAEIIKERTEGREYGDLEKVPLAGRLFKKSKKKREEKERFNSSL